MAALTAIPVSTAFATTPPDDANDVTQVDNLVDENDSGGFDDWVCSVSSVWLGWPV